MYSVEADGIRHEIHAAGLSVILQYVLILITLFQQGPLGPRALLVAFRGPVGEGVSEVGTVQSRCRATATGGTLPVQVPLRCV